MIINRHRAKFLKSKKAAIQNSDRLNEIFGIKSSKDSIDDFNNTGGISTTRDTTIDSSNYNEESSIKDIKEKIRKVDIITKVNEMSTNEYFAQKMKGLKIASSKSQNIYNNINIKNKKIFNLRDYKPANTFLRLINVSSEL